MKVQFMTWQVSVERIKPSTSELAEKYNSLARDWQRKIRRLGYDKAYGQMFEGVSDELRSGLPVSKKSILDCGVGTGALSAALTNSGLEDLCLHAVDISPAMLRIARSRLAQRGIPIRTHRQDVGSLSFPDNTFDMVMAAHTIEHLPAPKTGIEEMCRVLRPRAPLLIVTTRPGIWGSIIDAQWGLTCLNEETLVNILQSLGLQDVRLLQLGGWCRRMSYAVVGWKG